MPIVLYRIIVNCSLLRCRLVSFLTFPLFVRALLAHPGGERGGVERYINKFEHFSARHNF